MHWLLAAANTSVSQCLARPLVKPRQYCITLPARAIKWPQKWRSNEWIKRVITRPQRLHTTRSAKLDSTSQLTGTISNLLNLNKININTKTQTKHMTQPAVKLYQQLQASHAAQTQKGYFSTFRRKGNHRLQTVPQCCHLGSYFKHMPYSCCYTGCNIMCKHDVIHNTRST